MNRSQKLIRVLEGFKLGDLGAGKTRFVEPSKLKILKEDELESQGRKAPYLFWQDHDGLKYGLALIVTNPTEATLFFYAGKDLNHTGKFFAGATVIASLKTMKPYDEVLELFNIDKIVIKKDGVIGMFVSIPLMFRAVGGYQQSFEKWLKEKQGLKA